MKNIHFPDWLRRVGATIASWPWTRIGLITLCAILSVIFITMTVGTIYVNGLLSQIRRPNLEEPLPPAPDLEEPVGPPDDYTGEILDPDDIEQPDDPKVIIAHKDIVNIMLVGQDRRPGENYRTRSDAMILCTFNKQNKTITLTSFMRDMYVEIPGHKSSKMNAAYQWGGMSLLRETMMENFGVQVDAFIEVDFNGFEKVVNTVGGVNISLNKAEVEHLNSLYGYKLVVGNNHLNGEQALNYSRIRYVGNSDFERTERQRRVVDAIISKCKNASFSQLNNLLNNILPSVATDMTNSQILSYAVDLFPILAGSSIVQQRIPINGSYSFQWVGNLDVVLPDIELNRQYLVDTLLPK